MWGLQTVKWQSHKQTAFIPMNCLSMTCVCLCVCVRCDWKEAAGRKSILPVGISPAFSDPHYHSRPAFVLRQTHSFCTNCFTLVISPTKAHNAETPLETTKTYLTVILFHHLINMCYVHACPLEMHFSKKKWVIEITEKGQKLSKLHSTAHYF